ncbi:delta-60 repeat domain-containing protein [Pseudomonas triticicola]|uniref:delta-60 repeat domain-containing protein n=1 Tax=Pseudomonas triticicola TaxID=2842345 RepID=UPI003EB7B133
MNNQRQSTQAPIALDPSFNGTGVWQPQGLNPLPSLIFGVAAQSVSKGGYVYFTGEAHGGLRGKVFVLGRLKPDGTLDREFAKATNGLAHDNFAPNNPSAGFSIKLLEDGKILLVGLADGRSTPALGRFNSDGTLDKSFGTDGYVVLRRPSPERQLSAIEPVQEQDFNTCTVPMISGKILIVHTYIASHIADTRAFIFMLNSDGSPDTTFNKTGHLQVVSPGESPDSVKINSGFIDEKGNIVVCGNLTVDREPAGVFFARYTAEGVPDTSFHATGVRVFNSPDLVNATFRTLVRQTNNRLLGVGSTSDGRGLLISLEPDGTDNIQFNGGEPLFIRLENYLTHWRIATMQPDGKILLLGNVTTPEPPPSPRQSYGVLARLLSAGKEDTDFAADNFWIKARASTDLTSLALQEDGKVVVGGYEFATALDQVVVMRFQNGEGGNSTSRWLRTNAAPLDPGFGASSGIAMLSTPVAGLVSPHGIGLDHFRNIYVVGHLLISAGHIQYYCVRLTAAGTVDQSFNSGGYLIGDFPPQTATVSHSQFTDIVELSNGKLLLSGVYYEDRRTTSKGLLRLHPDGSVDTTYGVGGTKLIELHRRPDGERADSDIPRAASSAPPKGKSIMLADGRVLLLTLLEHGLKTSQTVIVCLMPDGEPDLDFGAGKGWRVIAHPGFPYTEINDVLIDRQGNYILGGFCTEIGGYPTHALLIKLLPTGNLDTSFADAGHKVIEGTDGSERFLIYRLVAQTNNRILAIGYSMCTQMRGLMISLESNGKSNIQFHGGAPLLTDLDGRTTQWDNAIIQADGKILVSGRSVGGRCVVARFDDAGKLDGSYGGGGWLYFETPSLPSNAQFCPDGKLLFTASLTVDNERFPCIARGLID